MYEVNLERTILDTTMHVAGNSDIFLQSLVSFITFL
jgi:hypothetical protein